MTDVNDRVMLIMQALNLSKTDFAKVININASGLSHIANKRNKPSIDLIISLLNAYPHINAEWVLTGKGSMYKDSVSINLKNTLQNALAEVAELQEFNNQAMKNRIDKVVKQLNDLL